MVSASRALNNSHDSTGHHSTAQWDQWGDLWVWITLFYIWTFNTPIKRREKIPHCDHLISYIAARALISFCGSLFALKISARHSASRHNAHVVVINHNYHGLKKPQLLFDFKNKP